MSGSVALCLLGMAAIFVGEQILADLATTRWIVDVVGALAIGGAIAWRWVRYRGTDQAGLKTGHRIALATTLVGAGSLLCYVLSTESTAAWLGATGSPSTWSVAWRALWPIVWGAGTLPLLVVDRALQQSPVVAPARRFRQALQHGLVAAFGLALIVPVNYLASRHATRWNLARFETARPGSATRSIVDSLERPVHVYAFLPPNSELVAEIDSYFAPLEGAALTLHRVDQTARPTLARQLEVRDNGHLVVSTASPEQLRERDGDVDEARGALNRRVELGTKLDEARDTLETLDQKVQEQLLSISSGERVLYTTRGHGEWTDEGPRAESLQGFERVVKAMGFRIESIGLDGLSGGVPDEADVVAIVAPNSPFMDREVEALRHFLDRGGSLMVALEPDYTRRNTRGGTNDGPLLGGLLERVGIRLGEGVLASTQNIVPMANNKTDRLNLVTDRFSSHPSTATLSKRSRELFLFTPGSGHVTPIEGSAAETTVTVRSKSSTWADLDGDLDFDDQEGESRGSRPVAMASTPKTDDGGAASTSRDENRWRALVAADATALSDLGLGNRGNQQFVYDGLNWLIGASALSGTVESGEDVRIRHTKEGQAIWFYATVVGLPLLIFIGGAIYVWRRRKQGGAS